MVYKKIGVDIDGVLCDFTGKFASILRDKFHIPLPKDFQPTDWHWKNANVSKDTISKAWEIIDSTPYFWESLAPLPDVISMALFFHEYVDKHCEIYFITARREGAGRGTREQTERWLREYLANPKQALNIIPVTKGELKKHVIHAMGIDHFIDDHAPTIKEATSVSTCDSYLLHKPWNSSEQEGLKVVKSLSDFLNNIKLQDN